MIGSRIYRRKTQSLRTSRETIHPIESLGQDLKWYGILPPSGKELGLVFLVANKGKDAFIKEKIWSS